MLHIIKQEVNMRVVEPIISRAMYEDVQAQKVHSKGIGFIENEIDWFPRQKDAVYEDRMRTKPQVFKNLPPLKGKFSKKNIKNIERFNRFVYDYWNNKL